MERLTSNKTERIERCGVTNKCKNWTVRVGGIDV